MTAPMIVALVLLAIFLVVAIPALRAWLRYRGKRLVTCPETKEPAAVDIAAGRAALFAVVATPKLHLRECSRWPEREACGQECLSQITAAPDGCLVRTMVTQWYADKSCAYCRKPIGEVQWYERPPALLGEDGKTVQWSDLRTETLPAMLGACRAVCWNCHVAESFRREHPKLVLDRPRKP